MRAQRELLAMQAATIASRNLFLTSMQLLNAALRFWNRSSHYVQDMPAMVIALRASLLAPEVASCQSFRAFPRGSI